MDENEIENSVLLRHCYRTYTISFSISSERKRDYTCELWRTERREKKRRAVGIFEWESGESKEVQKEEGREGRSPCDV